jgi:hypothetical protein
MNVRLRYLAALLLCALALLPISPILAQTTVAVVSGTIVDRKSALPVAGANVVLSQAGARVVAAQTDGAGRFLFSDVKPGLYDLTVSAHGYVATVDSGLVVAGGSTLTVDSTLLAAQATGTYQTIGRVSTSASALAAATTISQSVSVEDLLRTGQFRVFDQLQTLPGINGSTSSAPGDDAKINIRGFDPTETATLLDGHPVGPIGVQGPRSFNFADTPSFGLSDVTVTYGSGAQGLYGSDTVAGAINFETISPTVKPQYEFLQSVGGFGILTSGVSATGTYGKLGYALATAVQGTSGSFDGQQVFQSARPPNIKTNVVSGTAVGGSVDPPYLCSNYAGNDVSACNQAAETYAVGQDTKLTSEIAKLRYNFSPVTAFQTAFYSGISLADSTGNGDNDFLPYSSRLAQITTNSSTNCALPGGAAGYTVVTNPLTNATSCYTAQQWAAASSGPNGAGPGRDRSVSMRDYDFRFTTQDGSNNITLDSFINNYYYWKNSVQSGGADAAGGFIGTGDYTDFFNAHGYLVSDDIPTGRNDLGFGYTLVNQLQTSNGFSGEGPIDPSTGLNTLVNIPNYNFTTSYFSEGSGFIRDSYEINDHLSVFANVWAKRSSVTQKTTLDPRVTALARPTRHDVFRLTYGRSDGAPAQELKALGISQVTDPGPSLTSVSCGLGSNSVASAGNPNLTSENATDLEAGYGHRFQDDSEVQVNAYVTNLKNQLQNATEPLLSYGLGNVNFQGGALGTYIARLNSNGCLNGGVNASNVYQFLGVTTTYNLGNQLARGIEISGRERVNRILALDYGYYIESTQNFNLPNSVLANNATLYNGGQANGDPLHQGTVSVDIAPGPWDFRIDNFYTEQNNNFARPSYWHSNAFITRSFNHGKTLLTLGGTNIFNQAVQIYGYLGQGTFTRYNPVYAAVNGVQAANALQEYVNGINSGQEEFGLTPAQLTLTLTQRI